MLFDLFRKFESYLCFQLESLRLGLCRLWERLGRRTSNLVQGRCFGGSLKKRGPTTWNNLSLPPFCFVLLIIFNSKEERGLSYILKKSSSPEKSLAFVSQLYSILSVMEPLSSCYYYLFSKSDFLKLQPNFGAVVHLMLFELWNKMRINASYCLEENFI